jgi:hypothetical protein
MMAMLTCRAEAAAIVFCSRKKRISECNLTLMSKRAIAGYLFPTPKCRHDADSGAATPARQQGSMSPTLQPKFSGSQRGMPFLILRLELFKLHVAYPLITQRSAPHLNSKHFDIESHTKNFHKFNKMGGDRIKKDKRQKREDYRAAMRKDDISELPRKKFYRQRAHANPFSDHQLI